MFASGGPPGARVLETLDKRVFNFDQEGVMIVTCVETPGSRRSAYAIYYGVWPERSLKAKGWSTESGNARVVYTREGTLDEIKEAQESKRYLGWFYQSWQSVVDDEAKYGVDANKLRDDYYREGV